MSLNAVQRRTRRGRASRSGSSRDRPCPGRIAVRGPVAGTVHAGVPAETGPSWQSSLGTTRSCGLVVIPLADVKTREFVEQWRNASYNCYSSGHKFCREVCPVMTETRNESWTPTAFHANVVAMEHGELTIEDIAADYVNCTQCGACELRCPNTLFTGDFYRFRTRTVDVVKAVRAFAVESGIHQPGYRSWNARTAERSHEPVLGDVPVGQDTVRDWSHGLDIPIGGESILLRRLRGGLLSHLCAAGRRADPSEGGL